MTAAIGTLFGGGEMLAIDRIRRDPRTQPRNHINHEVVERYRDAMEAGDAFPPVTVFFDGAEYWLADGWHRVCAALCLGWQGIVVEIRPGGLRDAEWHSFSVNAKHGYARGRDDVERILNRIFADPEWSKKGLRAIHRHTHIPWSTVQYKYGKFVSSGQFGQMGKKPTMREAERQDGTTYEIETAPIGRAADVWRQTDIEESTGAPSDWRGKIKPAEDDDEDEPHPRQGCGNCKHSLYVTGSGSLICLMFEKETSWDSLIGEECPCWEPDPNNEDFQQEEDDEPEPDDDGDDRFAFKAFPPEHAQPPAAFAGWSNSCLRS
jgi:hypothetical protein